MYFVETKNGLKLDWGATTGFNPVAFTGWGAGGGGATNTLRVSAQLSDEFTSNYTQLRGNRYAIQCEEEFGEIDGYFTGYAEIRSDLGGKIFELLKDGQKHQLTLTFSRLDRDRAIAASIEAVVSDSWSF